MSQVIVEMSSLPSWCLILILAWWLAYRVIPSVLQTRWGQRLQPILRQLWSDISAACSRAAVEAAKIVVDGHERRSK
jgi:hypothetical protein